VTRSLALMVNDQDLYSVCARKQRHSIRYGPDGLARGVPTYENAPDRDAVPLGGKRMIGRPDSIAGIPQAESDIAGRSRCMRSRPPHCSSEKPTPPFDPPGIPAIEFRPTNHPLSAKGHGISGPAHSHRWNATREAIRAVADAVPLLARADAVEVLIVDHQRQRARHGQEPGRRSYAAWRLSARE